MLKLIDMMEDKYTNLFKESYPDKYRCLSTLLDPTDTTYYFMVNGYFEYVLNKIDKEYDFVQYVPEHFVLVRE